MADYTEGCAAPRAPVNAGKYVNIAGAAVSLGLMIGVGVWGYKLVMRDVSGVPVVRAMEGPMRLSPDNPGGEIAANMGLAVNEVAAEGEASAPEEAEQVVLAPPVVELSEEDLEVMPTAEAGEVLPSPEASVPSVEVATSLEVAPDTPAEIAAAPAADEPLTAEQILALADQIASGAASIEPVEEADAAPVQTAINGVPSDVIADIVPSSVPGVSSSPRPIARARTMAAATPAPAAEAAPAEGDAAITTASIPVGTNLVQLGAYESASIAEQEWTRFQGRFGDFMEGKERVIQKAERGGRTFYRLRAMGFAEISDARRFCAALVSEGTDCVPVVVR